MILYIIYDYTFAAALPDLFLQVLLVLAGHKQLLVLLLAVSLEAVPLRLGLLQLPRQPHLHLLQRLQGSCLLHLQTHAHSCTQEFLVLTYTQIT